MIHDDLKACQAACHHWGVSRRVTFDAAKEHFCILHKLHGSGDTFRLLGVLIDVKLTMEDETVTIRDRNTMQQERISIADLKEKIGYAVSMERIFEKLL